MNTPTVPISERDHRRGSPDVVLRPFQLASVQPHAPFAAEAAEAAGAS